IFQTLGLRTTSPARSAFITALSVLLVPVLGFLLFHHRPRRQTVAGVVIATAGLGLLTLESLELSLNRGDVLTLICAFVFAFHILYVGRYVTEGDYRQLVALQIAGSAVLSTIILPIVESLGPRSWRLHIHSGSPGHRRRLLCAELGPEVHDPEPDRADLQH
ncbi:MAG: protein of unknown function transrane, partial [Acidobacteria bacterium]|nr:protein of unknown function transrane [Acidobacteriota bacterium]